MPGPHAKRKKGQMTTSVEQAATDPYGPTGRLAAWVADLSLDDVPSVVTDRAKHLILDGLGCALIGAQLPWSRVATQAVLDIEGAGDTVVVGTGRTTSAPAAAVLNGTYIQGFELDDFHPVAPLHNCALVLPALLSTVSLLSAVRGADFLLAAITGFEVGPRVGYTLHGSQMLDRGWHSGSVFGTHSAAMASGKLRGLVPAQLEDALGLAGTQSSGLMAAQFEAMSKRMHHGFASRNGFYAARACRTWLHRHQTGFRARLRRILERFRRGPQSRSGRVDRPARSAMGDHHHHGQVVFGDGRTARCDRRTRQLRAAHSIDPQHVSKIDITVGTTVYRHGWWKPERPLTAIGAQMNIGYVTAAALLDGNVLPEQFTPRAWTPTTSGR